MVLAFSAIGSGRLIIFRVLVLISGIKSTCKLGGAVASTGLPGLVFGAKFPEFDLFHRQLASKFELVLWIFLIVGLQAFCAEIGTPDFEQETTFLVFKPENYKTSNIFRITRY